jgi:hypothetical protein
MALVFGDLLDPTGFDDAQAIAVITLAELDSGLSAGQGHGDTLLVRSGEDRA